MAMTRESLKDTAKWKKQGIALPEFDIDKMRAETEKKPQWIHFGSGNIFRGFLAQIQQKLLNKGVEKTGIVAVEAFDYEIIKDIYKPNDELSLLVTLNADGAMDKTVLASVADSIAADSADEKEWSKLLKIATDPSLEMISFTITEKGYNIYGANGGYFSDVEKDIKNGPSKPLSIMPKVTALLVARFNKGKLPVALVSMDNCSHNGDKLRKAVMEIANKWVENKKVSKDFLDYLNDETKVTFPCSMIDKITPRPSPVVKEHLEKIGFDSTDIVVTSKHTYIAPFVNTEAPQYLVIEDKFPNGRPQLEKAGIYFTDLETVEKSERMKLCTCLNPLHTSLAVFGCLLGYTSIAAEMKDKALCALVNGIGLKEGMPVVVDPKIIKPMDFIKEVIEKRLPNAFIPDTPQRIVSDTSQKIPNRYGITIKNYIERKDLDVKTLTYIPLVIAGWCRYLLAKDDNLEKMELSFDPMMEELQGYLKDVIVDEPMSAKDALRPILTNKTIFGCDLYEVGLGEKVEDYFTRMLTGKHAVRTVLESVVL